MSATPAPPAGISACESPKARMHRAVSRSKSFHQAFLEAISGTVQAPDDQQRSLDVTFPELYKKALLRAYATRPPEDDCQSPTAPAAGSKKGRFTGAAARLKTFVGPGKGGAVASGDPPSAPDTAEDGGGGEGSDPEPEDAAPPAVDEADDPAAAALAAEFQAMSDGDGGGGGGGMLGQLKAVFDEGGELDNSQSEEGGGSAPDPQASLKKALKEQMDSGKEKMEEALEESFNKFMKKGAKESEGDGAAEQGAGAAAAVAALAGAGSGGGGGGGGLFAAVREAAQKKLQEAKEAADQATAAVGGGGNGGSDEEDEKEEEEEEEEKGPEIKSEKRAPVHGKDPWLPSGLSPRQVELRCKARELVVEHVLPNVARWDRERTLPRKFLRAAGRHGFCGMVAPLLAGGRGWSYADAVSVLEVLGAADLNSAALVAHQNRMAWMMSKYAGLAHRLPLTAAMTAGLLVGTCAASEPGARKDLDKTTSFGIKYMDMSGEWWILNGFKDFTPLCGQADLYLVAVRTGSSAKDVTLFLLPKFYPGLNWLGPTYDTVGVRSLTHRDMVMASCVVRTETRVAVGEAGKCIQEGGDRFRLFLAAAAVGAATSGLAMAHDWMEDPAHRHFSHSLLGYQALEHRLMALMARVDAARLTVQHAAAAFDAQAATAPAHAAMAKRHAVRTALDVLEGVRTLFGAASVHVSYPLERVRRNLMAYQLLGGDMQECVELAWSGLVSKRKAKVKSRKGGGAGAGGAGPVGLAKRTKVLTGAGGDEDDENADDDDGDGWGDDDDEEAY